VNISYSSCWTTYYKAEVAVSKMTVDDRISAVDVVCGQNVFFRSSPVLHVRRLITCLWFVATEILSSKLVRKGALKCREEV
jgi:hypothetical protein